MVAPWGPKPITDKREYSGSIPGLLVFWKHQRRYWQTPPYNLVLPYVMVTSSYRQSRSQNYYGSGLAYGAESVYDMTYPPDAVITRAHNASYEQLKGNVYTSASLGVTFAESSQAMQMIEKAAGSIWRSMRRVKKLDFIGAARELGMDYVPSGVNKKRKWADNWLEYHFGWVPFISDAYAASEVLANPYKNLQSVKGVGRDHYTYTNRFNAGSVSGGVSVTSSVVSYQGATVQAISNGTLHTLDQFGLLNPAVIAWELVPFSFVIDWFANVGDVLQSYSDFAGMDLIGTYTSTIIRGTVAGYTKLSPGYPGTPGWSGLAYNGRSVRMDRSQFLTKPAFVLKNLTLPSKERAFTAVALVTQIASGNSGGNRTYRL